MKIDFSQNILKITSQSKNDLLQVPAGVNASSTSSWSDPAFKWFFTKANLKKSSSSIIKFLEEPAEKIIAALLILMFSPVFILVACGVKLTSKGDILYKQVRVGKNGKLFKIYKFRSMVSDAEAKTGHVLSWSGDPRITKFGNFLRKSHLDELPQLFNVIFGNMAFIGPRPERPQFTEKYDQEIPDYIIRHTVKPGITGLAQVALVYDANAKEKLQYDLIYIKHKDSLVFNALVAFHTAKKMLFLKPKSNLVVS